MSSLSSKAFFTLLLLLSSSFLGAYSIPVNKANQKVSGGVEALKLNAAGPEIHTVSNSIHDFKERLVRLERRAKKSTKPQNPPSGHAAPQHHTPQGHVPSNQPAHQNPPPPPIHPAPLPAHPVWGTPPISAFEQGHYNPYPPYSPTHPDAPHQPLGQQDVGHNHPADPAHQNPPPPPMIPALLPAYPVWGTPPISAFDQGLYNPYPPYPPIHPDAPHQPLGQPHNGGSSSSHGDTGNSGRT